VGVGVGVGVVGVLALVLVLAGVVAGLLPVVVLMHCR
jgi:hypothetical protein